MHEYNNLNKEERLQAENEFLKMKLALERGMHLHAPQGEGLSPDIENEFLKNIIEFEKQFDEHKTIKVFDKIGRPDIFLPIAEIEEHEIDKKYAELLDYIGERGISFSICSPNISKRELYRFITEELFETEVDDINIPGMISGFIYDEFYPDPVYDNTRLVKEDLLRDIFTLDDLFFELHYVKEGLIFNGVEMSFDEYKNKVQRFKSLCSEIDLPVCDVTDCILKDDTCIVKGNYEAVAIIDAQDYHYNKSFEIKLVKSEIGYWDVQELALENFNL